MDSHTARRGTLRKEKTFRVNKFLGPKIVEASWIAIRHDAELSAKFGALCARGMKSQEAIIRIARKLSNIIFSVTTVH